MASINPRLLVKTMTEKRARILFAFLFAGHAMDVEELATWTGSPRNTHYTELASLCADGLLARSSQKMASGREIYLLGSDVLPLLQDLSGRLGAGKYLEDSTDLLESSQAPALGAGYSLPRRSAVVAPDVQYQERGVTFEKNMAACRKMHIGEPSATTISLLEWASPDFIKAHVDDLEPGDTIGLAILRIKNNETPCSWNEEARDIAKSYLLDRDDEEEGEYDPTGEFCIWQDELEEVIQSGPLRGKHRRTPMCHKPCKKGSAKWCEEHYEIGTAAYDSCQGE